MQFSHANPISKVYNLTKMKSAVRETDFHNQNKQLWPTLITVKMFQIKLIHGFDKLNFHTNILFSITLVD